MANAIDLRKVETGSFWASLRSAMGQDGLLTYRYLGRVAQNMHGVPVGSMKIRSDMRDWHGGIRAAVLAIATAETGFSDFNAVPAPIEAGLSILDAGRDVREVQLRAEVLKLGRTLGFSRTFVTDADQPEKVIAISRGVGIKLAEAPESGGEPFPLPDDMADAGELPSLLTVFGGVLDGDVCCLPELSAGSSSTSGSLHLGPIHIALDAIADANARQHRMRIADWNVMFLSAGTHGPFRAELTRRMVQAGDGAVVLSLVDEGRDDRLVATATAVLRSVDL
ncbi:MAG: hypothetical protein KDE32_00665 [Novosphingobium sp.]|nr:hypothetical protein [Novosphingobium sp.]